MQDGEPDREAGGPEDARRRRAFRTRSARAFAGVPAGPSPEAEQAGWRAWVRAHPALALVCVGFCVVAIGGLMLSLPREMFSTARPTERAGGASPPAAHADAPPPRAPGPPAPGGEVPSAPPGEAGPWVEVAPAPPSGRGLALSYRYRTLPAGGESRYEWIVQVRGDQRLLDGIALVGWRMEPAAKNGADFVSRDRAADGFPLFGHGPGGWFAVSARVRYRDGGEETLARRVELSD